MATYILFWNPGISSYTRDRFICDFDEREDVGNWSFHEHEEVKEGDTFYMVKCGEGKTGIVMRGTIESECYEGEDWSPKRRRPIYYANIETYTCINPWSEAALLTPELLTAKLPDFNWHGGHSGRKLDEAMAQKLDEIWFSYLDCNPKMFSNEEAWIWNNSSLIPESVKEKLLEKRGRGCEVCGYDYARVFGSDCAAHNNLSVWPRPLKSPILKRLFYNICLNCRQAPEEVLVDKVKGL
ncbi:MAG: hypothetical protein K2G07_06355 [Muribaculaceae bacterium]|nr:hypothetical protein [Muribaculaceae bacterium]